MLASPIYKWRNWAKSKITILWVAKLLSGPRCFSGYSELVLLYLVNSQETNGQGKMLTICGRGYTIPRVQNNFSPIYSNTFWVSYYPRNCINIQKSAKGEWIVLEGISAIYGTDERTFQESPPHLWWLECTHLLSNSKSVTKSSLSDYLLCVIVQLAQGHNFL